MELANIKIAIIGLGYVGLPLAVEFGKKFPVVGFDINEIRIDELKNSFDRTREVSGSDIKSSHKLLFSCNEADLEKTNVYIITVPTPIDKYKRPDLNPLVKASEVVGKFLSEGDIVIYESTVYPGCTEEICVPVLEKVSGLVYNRDFFCGYSPERINPGDKYHTLTNIKKITSGSNDRTAKVVNSLYEKIITAGTFLAPSIRVAEAAKVIENAQRDLNIAFVNELAKIFKKLNIDTNDVLDAASTKWNFLNFRPGLVGGHCIGVDPYYLTHKAQEIGYHPEIILAGRRLNDGMAEYIADEIIGLMIRKNQRIEGSNVLVLGITFKENCPDIRNTKVVDLISRLKSFNLDIEVYDPWASAEEVYEEYFIKLLTTIEAKKYNAIILAVPHNEFKQLEIKNYCYDDTVVYDIKSLLPKEFIDDRL